MRDHRAHNYSTRTLATAKSYRIAVSLMMLVALGLTASQPSAGQSGPQGRTTDIPAGLDIFKTVQAGSRFQFRNEFTIPAGFFDQGSRPFAGTVNFKGLPLGSFRERKTGEADTIVERKSAATFSAPEGRATVPIEVVALSLESDRPIRVQVGRDWQTWNVKLELSPSRKSEGTMTLTRRNAKGGTFNSELLVYALFTFTRQSDGLEKRLDTGEMRLSSRAIEMLTLRATGVPWAQSCSQVPSGDICPGVTPAGLVIGFSHSAPSRRHMIILPTPQD